MSSRRRRAVKDIDDEESSGSEDSSHVSEAESTGDEGSATAPVQEVPHKSTTEVELQKQLPPTRERKVRNRRRKTGSATRNDSSDIAMAEVEGEKEPVKKSPSFVPRGGQFFLHDNRQHNNSRSKNEEKPGGGKRVAAGPSRKSDETAWKHDLFESSAQETKEKGQPIKALNNRRNRRGKTDNTQDSIAATGANRAGESGPPAVQGGWQPDITGERQPREHKKKNGNISERSEAKSSSVQPESGQNKTKLLQQHKQRKPASIQTDVGMAAQGWQPVAERNVTLKASAPEFTPTSPLPVAYNGGTQREYVGQTLHYPTYSDGAGTEAMTYRTSGRSNRYSSDGPEAGYSSAAEYNGTVMYGYTDGNVPVGGYYGGSYDGYVPPAGGIDMGTSGRASNGTVWFPTTPNGAPTDAGMVSSPAVYNGTQYFPTSPSPVYYEQPRHVASAPGAYGREFGAKGHNNYDPYAQRR